MTKLLLYISGSFPQDLGWVRLGPFILFCNGPLAKLLPIFALVLDSKAHYASKLRIVMLDRRVSMTHQHLAKEIDAMSSMPWGRIIGQIL